MRRLSTFAAAGITASALLLTACGTNADTSSDEGSASASSGGSGDLKVALAYDVGGRGDKSFNDAAYAGLQEAKKAAEFESTEGEASTDEDEATRENRLRGFADDGYNVVVGVGFAYSESVNAVAPDYPDVNFAIIDGFDPDEEENANVAYLTFAEEQGSFLVGAAAALQTESDQIGFVGGVNNALIQKFEAGYVAGAKEVNPDIDVAVTYLEETDVSGFNAPDDGQAAATAMYDDGADIVYHASGASGAGVFDAATQADKFAIGVDSDQWQSASAEQKPHIMTSMLKRVDVATKDFIASVESGSPQTGYTTFDLKADGVGYSTSGDLLTADTISQLDGFKQQIVDGDIKVPTAP
ncbi:MAG: BMP family ABC transporter substrate-binding protein [Nocardioidaceae bacterium]|nr:BMP family ABC transporter substrate-binding protein [Nocardioidaceae bacterium]